MILRRLKATDLPHIRTLLESTGVFAPEEIECAVEVVDDVITKADDYEGFVAVDEEDLPLSYVVYSPTPMTESTWVLYWIATHSRAKGKGVGSVVIARMEQDIRERNGRMIRIETSGKDAYGPTRGFYEKTQYRPVGHFPNFYRAGDDLVILGKDLESAARAVAVPAPAVTPSAPEAGPAILSRLPS